MEPSLTTATTAAPLELRRRSVSREPSAYLTPLLALTGMVALGIAVAATVGGSRFSSYSPERDYLRRSSSAALSLRLESLSEETSREARAFIQDPQSSAASRDRLARLGRDLAAAALDLNRVVALDPARRERIARLALLARELAASASELGSWPLPAADLPREAGATYLLIEACRDQIALLAPDLQADAPSL